MMTLLEISVSKRVKWIFVAQIGVRHSFDAVFRRRRRFKDFMDVPNLMPDRVYGVMFSIFLYSS